MALQTRIAIPPAGKGVNAGPAVQDSHSSCRGVNVAPMFVSREGTASCHFRTLAILGSEHSGLDILWGIQPVCLLRKTEAVLDP